MDITAMIMEHLPFNYTEDNLRAINYFLSSDINALVDGNHISNVKYLEDGILLERETMPPTKITFIKNTDGIGDAISITQNGCEIIKICATPARTINVVNTKCMGLPGELECVNLCITYGVYHKEGTYLYARDFINPNGIVLRTYSSLLVNHDGKLKIVRTIPNDGYRETVEEVKGSPNDKYTTYYGYLSSAYHKEPKVRLKK
jgi:hypothetical protein